MPASRFRPFFKGDDMRLKSILLVLTALFLHCNNYDLLEKLQNPAVAGSTTAKLYAFVNPSSTLGNMSGLTNGGCSGSGITRADCSCQDFAVANGLIRTSGTKFVAWLSSTTEDMRCRLPGGTSNNCAIPDRIVTWYNMMDEPIATSYQDLFDGNILNPIKYTPNKQLTGAAKVWSGTDSNGLRGGAGAATANCTNWTDGSATATAPVYGTPLSTGTGWSNTGTEPDCSGSYPVYCLQVP